MTCPHGCENADYCESCQYEADGRRGCSCCDPTSDSHDPVVVRLERELDEANAILEVYRRGFYMLSGSLRDGHRIAWQDGMWWLFDFNGEGVESEHTLELLVKKLGGE